MINPYLSEVQHVVQYVIFFTVQNDKEIISLFNNIIQSDSNDEVKITANECINFVKTHEHIREKPPEIDPKYLSKEIEELENIETYN